MDELMWSVGGVGINRDEPKYSEKNLVTMAFTGFVNFSGLSSDCRGFYLEVERNRVLFHTAGFTECVRRLMLLET
jgi:hypothetical protein